MNRRSERTSWIGGAIGVGLLAAIAQGAHLPEILSGPNLRVAAGSAPDPHLLSAWLDRLLFASCAQNGACIHNWNAIAFAIVVAAIGTVAVLRAAAGARAIALLALGVAAFSPLAVPLVVDPLGLAMTLGVALVALAAIDASGISSYHVVARCALVIALCLQDPLLIFVAFAYGAILAFRRSGGPAGAAPLLLAVLAPVARSRVLPAFHVDPLAGPATLVVAGVMLFVGGPALVVLSKWNVFALIDVRIQAFGPALILAASALLGGAFAPSGDPGAYWLAAEIALVAGVYQAISRDVPPLRLRNILVLFCMAFGLQFWALVANHASNTSVIVADQSASLRSFIDRDAAPRCVVSDPQGNRYLLASGAFLRAYDSAGAIGVVRSPQQCLDRSDDTRLATINGLYVNDYGATLPLWRLARTGPTAGTLAIQDGAVFPKTAVKTPTGTGEFGNSIATPLGPVGDFTVLSSFAYTPTCVAVRDGNQLRFEISTIPGNPELAFTVATRGGVIARNRYRGLLPPTAPDASTVWQHVSIPLHASNCAAFTFAVLQPPGERFNYWVTFAGATVR